MGEGGEERNRGCVGVWWRGALCGGLCFFVGLFVFACVCVFVWLILFRYLSEFARMSLYLYCMRLPLFVYDVFKLIYN